VSWWSAVAAGLVVATVAGLRSSWSP